MALKVETASVKIGDAEGRNNADIDMSSRLQKKIPPVTRQLFDPMRLLFWAAIAFLFSIVILNHQWKMQSFEARLSLLEQKVAAAAAAAAGCDAQRTQVASSSRVSYIGEDESSAEIQRNVDISQHEWRTVEESDATDDMTIDVIESASRRRRSADVEVQSDGPPATGTVRNPSQGRGTRRREEPPRNARKVWESSTDSTPPRPKSTPVPKSAAVTDPYSTAFHMEFHIHMTDEERHLCHDGKSNITLSNGGVCRPVGYSLNAFSSSDVYRTWRPAEWARSDASKNYYVYDKDTGKLKVMQSGIYNVYAQILYHNSANRMGYAVMVGDDDAFMKCWSSVDVALGNSSLENSRYKTCHVGAAVKLNKQQELWIKDLYGHPVVIDQHSSYFGIIKVADIQ